MSLQLALTEYCKDYGRKNAQRGFINLMHIGETSDGDRIFEVTDPYEHPRVHQWVLERVDVERFSKNNIVLDTRTTLTPLMVSNLMDKTVGHHLAITDIGSIERVSGGWVITIAEDSWRYHGSFKIKNKRGK